MAISTNGTVLARLAGALYNTQMSNATYKEVASLDPSALADVLYARDFSASTDAAVATTLVSNLGLASVTGLDNWVAAQLTAAGSHKGAKVVELLNSFAQMTADTTYGAYATAFNTKVDAALALSQTTDNAGGTFAAAGVATDKTFTLTTSTDTFTGGATADTFTAEIGRLNNDDALTGGAGNDTLNARLGATVTPVINGVETLNIEATAAASVDGAQITGATTVNVSGGNTLTYLKEDGEVFHVAGAGTGLTTGKAADATAGDAITVYLDSGALGEVSVGTEGTMEYETVNLVANGATSVTLSDAGTDDWSDSDEKIVVSGGSNLTLKIAGAGLGWNTSTGSAVAATIDASGHTANLTVDVGAAGAQFLDVSKMTGVDAFKVSTTSSTANGTFTLKGAYSGQSLTVSSFGDSDDDLTIALKTATPTNDTFNVVLQNSTAGTSVTGDVLTTTGIETVTVTSGGTNIAATATADATVVANTLGGIVTTTTTSALVVAGDKKLTISSVDADITNITVTNTTGSDLVLASSSGVLTYTGGAGADRLEIDTVAELVSSGTSADTLAGGDGRDTLAFSAVPSAVTAAQLARATGFEILEFKETNTVGSGGATQSIRGTTFDTFFLNGDLEVADTKILTLQAQDGVTVKMGASADASGSTGGAANFVIDVLNAADAGSNNTVNLQTVNAASTDYAIAGFTIDNVENLNIKVTGDESGSADVVTLSSVAGAQLQSIVITSTNAGASNVTPVVSDSLTITTATSTLLNNVDASGFTGALTITGLASKLIATGATVKGGSGADAITGGSGADTITGGAGVDTLKGGAANDNINGGSGNDNIYGDSGSDNLTGGTGTDTFFFATGDSTKTSMDKISDFSATASDRSYDILNTVGSYTTSRAAATLQSAATGTDLTGATTETDVGTVLGAITAAGKITFSGTSVANLDTLAEYVDAALIMLVSATSIATGYRASSIGFFEYNGNTYVVEETTTDVSTTETVTSSVVELTGVTGITGLSTSAAAGYITFA